MVLKKTTLIALDFENITEEALLLQKDILTAGTDEIEF
jgi:hypothetical protein